ncbi:hypothetical protein HYU17_03015 [Candidatus Woesearchaeota archaeon]|nr:hypothetical protein [Candidatus Woesearchaeota archaeon]
MRETAIFTAAEAVDKGIEGVSDILPPLHSALMSLEQLQLALIGVQRYGTGAWPSAELGRFGEFLACIGAAMDGHNSQGMHEIASYLGRYGLGLARAAIFTPPRMREIDWPGIVEAHRPSLVLSQTVISCLFVEALAKGLTAPTGGAGKNELGYLRARVHNYLAAIGKQETGGCSHA